MSDPILPSRRGHHPETTGGTAGRGPGRGENKVVGVNPNYKWGKGPISNRPRPGHPRPGTTDGDRNR